MPFQTGDGNATNDAVTLAQLAQAIIDHEGDPDPHPDYQLEAEKGVAGGYPELDGGGKVPTAQLPAATEAAKGTVELAANGENAAGVAVQGNDGRMSNARAPRVSSGTLIRAAGVASGNEVVAHGLPGAPLVIFFHGEKDGAANCFSRGSSTGTGIQECHRQSSLGANSSLATAIHVVDNIGNGHTGVVSAVDGADFTVAWTLVAAGLAIHVPWTAIG